jgi:hypothetical protein
MEKQAKYLLAALILSAVLWAVFIYLLCLIIN